MARTARKSTPPLSVVETTEVETPMVETPEVEASTEEEDKRDPIEVAKEIANLKFPTAAEVQALWLIDQAHDGKATINDLVFTMTMATKKAVYPANLSELLKGLVAKGLLFSEKTKGGKGKEANLYRITVPGEKLIDALNPIVEALDTQA